MNINIKYILFVILAIFFYSCSADFNNISKDNNSIIFYSQNSDLKYKQINLDASGHILSIHIFKNNKLDIEWVSNYYDLIDFVEYYGNGQIKVQGYLKNNKKHSLWSYFDREGHLLIERYFSYGKPSSIWIWYNHDNHNIDYYKVYPDHRDDGILTRYYQSSNVKEEKRYIDDKLDGDYSLFYDNKSNSIQLKGQYLFGSKRGSWEMFDQRGRFQNFFK